MHDIPSFTDGETMQGISAMVARIALVLPIEPLLENRRYGPELYALVRGQAASERAAELGVADSTIRNRRVRLAARLGIASSSTAFVCYAANLQNIEHLEVADDLMAQTAERFSRLSMHERFHIRLAGLGVRRRVAAAAVNRADGTVMIHRQNAIGSLGISGLSGIALTRWFFEHGIFRANLAPWSNSIFEHLPLVLRSRR
jgi:hypothetical protein